MLDISTTKMQMRTLNLSRQFELKKIVDSNFPVISQQRHIPPNPDIIYLQRRMNVPF